MLSFHIGHLFTMYLKSLNKIWYRNDTIQIYRISMEQNEYASECSDKGCIAIPLSRIHRLIFFY